MSNNFDSDPAEFAATCGTDYGYDVLGGCRKAPSPLPVEYAKFAERTRHSSRQASGWTLDFVQDTGVSGLVLLAADPQLLYKVTLNQTQRNTDDFELLTSVLAGKSSHEKIEAVYISADPNANRVDVYLVAEDHDDAVYEALVNMEEAVYDRLSSKIEIEFHVRATRGRPCESVAPRNANRII